MTSKILLDNISFKSNPSSFLDSIELDITFTAVAAIPTPLEWQIIYVGSAKSEQYDQVLEEFQIGPITEESTMKFTVECSPPDHLKIPRDELLCVTAIILTISYKKQQFIRVGYYVHNVITEDLLQEERANASIETLVKHTRRTILTDKPRITKFRINWGDVAMKEQTNNNLKMEKIYDSNNSVLDNKMGIINQQSEEKQSTREQKDQSSHFIMKSQVNPSSDGLRYNSEPI